MGVEVEELPPLGCCTQMMMRIHNFQSLWGEVAVGGWLEFVDLLGWAEEQSQLPALPRGPWSSLGRVFE